MELFRLRGTGSRGSLHICLSLWEAVTHSRQRGPWLCHSLSFSVIHLTDNAAKNPCLQGQRERLDFVYIAKGLQHRHWALEPTTRTEPTGLVTSTGELARKLDIPQHECLRWQGSVPAPKICSCDSQAPDPQSGPRQGLRGLVASSTEKPTMLLQPECKCTCWQEADSQLKYCGDIRRVCLCKALSGSWMQHKALKWRVCDRRYMLIASLTKT